jgi:hypothetical protein
MNPILLIFNKDSDMFVDAICFTDYYSQNEAMNIWAKNRFVKIEDFYGISWTVKEISHESAISCGAEEIK